VALLTVDHSMRPRRRSFFVSSGKLPSHILTIWMAQVVPDHQGVVASTAARGQVDDQSVCVAGVYQRVRMMVAIPDQVSQLACAQGSAPEDGARNILAKLPGPCRVSSQASNGARSPLIMAATYQRAA
jgi:hypothetical protein